MVQPILTPEESARLDAGAADRIEQLMERAGLWVALAAVEMGAGYGVRVSVLAGPGNNGGDAYVAAKYLRRRGAAVTVHALAFPKGEDSPARKAGAAAAHAGVSIVRLDGSVAPGDLIVDGLFGVGFHGELPERVLPWLAASASVLAIDVPSGLNASDGTTSGPAFQAAATVTFHALKVGHVVGEGPDRCGPTWVRDIGLEGGVPEMLLAEEEDAPRPSRQRTDHKWSAGSVLVVGGSPGLTGAAVLTGRAALEAGAGAVAIAVPGRWQPVVEGLSAGVMSRPIGTGERFDPSDVDEVLDFGTRFDVMALGPGLGPEQDKFVAELLSRWDKPLVVDADGLNALRQTAQLENRPGPTVITPHSGEFTKLAGVDASYQSASSLARAANIVVLLKGNPTFVCGPEDTWVVDAGGPELSTIGTGDVLTGTVAALWAQGLEPQLAARSGAYWHGLAGRDLALQRRVTAEELVGAVGRFVK